jgi:drug/metabolite transporter (DMT)-like permease
MSKCKLNLQGLGVLITLAILFISSNKTQAQTNSGECGMPSGPYRYYGMLIIAMAFWGGSWVSAKLTVDLAPGMTMTIGFLRFFTASVFLGILLLIQGPRPIRIFRRNNIKILSLVGFTGIFGYGVFFLTGMNFTTAAQGAIIAGVNPATVSLVAHLVHHERLSKSWQYSGFVLAFTGIVFVVGVQSLIEFNLQYLIGNLFILVAVVTWGIYSSVGKEAMKTLTPLEVTTGGAIIGSILFGIGALHEQFWIHPARFELLFWENILYLGIFVTVIGFLFYFISINELGASRAGAFINLVPVFGTLFSAMIMPEDTIYWTFGVGLILVIVGIMVINFPQRHATQSNRYTSEET